MEVWLNEKQILFSKIVINRIQRNLYVCVQFNSCY